MKLSELLSELEAAVANLKEKEAAERRASADTTQVRNEVNNLQKSIDAEMAKLKREASWNTDWHSQRNGAPIPAPGCEA
jgi:chromosome segregation ATPase